MIIKFALGGLYGVVVGATTGWLWFGTIGGAIGVSCAMAACVCGALAALDAEDDTS